MKTIGYRIEAVPIEQTRGFFRKIWFLDKVETDEQGRVSLTTICSGDERKCIEMRNSLIATPLVKP